MAYDYNQMMNQGIKDEDERRAGITQTAQAGAQNASALGAKAGATAGRSLNNVAGGQAPLVASTPTAQAGSQTPLTNQLPATPYVANGAPTGQVAGSNYVNFDRLMAANQVGTNNAVNKLAQGAEQKGQQFGNTLGQLQGQYKTQNDWWRGTGGPTKGVGAQGALGGYTNPTAGGMAWTMANGGNAQDAYNHQYKDLTEVEGGGYGTAAKQAAAAQQAAQGLQTHGGIQAQLQDAYGKQGGYNQGMSSMDAALAGAAGGDRFGELGKKYGALEKTLADANSAAAADYTANATAPVSDANPDPYGYKMTVDEQRKAEEELRKMEENWDELYKLRDIHAEGASDPAADEDTYYRGTGSEATSALNSDTKLGRRIKEQMKENIRLKKLALANAKGEQVRPGSFDRGGA